MIRRAAWRFFIVGVVLAINAFSASVALAGKPVFRAIGADTAPAAQPRTPGALYLVPGQVGQIRAVDATHDQVLAASRAAVPPTVAPPSSARVLSRDMAQAIAQSTRTAEDQALLAQIAVRADALQAQLNSPTATLGGRRAVRLTAGDDGLISLVASPSLASPRRKGSKALYSLEVFKDQIRQAASLHGVDESLVRAVIHAESSFRPTAVSAVGAGGLMQLMPGTARRFGVANRFDISQNIDGGTQYLAWLLKRYNGNVSLTAAAYNAGEGAVDRYGGVPPYRETRSYVSRVQNLFERYSRVAIGLPDALAWNEPASPRPGSYTSGVRIISSASQ